MGHKESRLGVDKAVRPNGLRRDQEGWLIASASLSIWELDSGLTKAREIARLDVPPNSRFNVGKCGTQGKLWVGKMAVDQ